VVCYGGPEWFRFSLTVSRPVEESVDEDAIVPGIPPGTTSIIAEPLSARAGTALNPFRSLPYIRMYGKLGPGMHI
jgi:hypothetical protein